MRYAHSLLLLSCIAIALMAAAAAPALADSIVYAKDGNLFLTSSDGSKGYQLTFDGGYSSPSQADNGIIGAIQHKRLVRLDRSGRLLNAPVQTLGSPNIGGPYEARISPDGTRFAYSFYVQTSFDDYENDIRWIDTGSYSAWTYADRFTSPASESEYLRSLEQAEWVTNDRVLGTQGFAMNMWSWRLGTGHGYTHAASQFWFGLRDPMDEWGVEAYHWYDDPALSHDGSKLAMTDGSGARLMLAAVPGPAWSGEPPYPEPDYINLTSDLAPPTLACASGEGTYVNPSWSRDGDALAYGGSDGVHVMAVPDGLDCGAITDRLVAPGGTEPAFGPADVELPKGGVRIAALSLRPRAFKAGRGTTVRYTLSDRAPVKITVGRRVIRVKGRAGENRVRFRSRGLRPGRYRLRVTATGGDSAVARFTVRR